MGEVYRARDTRLDRDQSPADRIGPDGAGKTTLLNRLSRIYTPEKGEVVLAGRQSLLRLPRHRIAPLGCPGGGRV